MELVNSKKRKIAEFVLEELEFDLNNGDYEDDLTKIQILVMIVLTILKILNFLKTFFSHSARI